MSAVQDTPEEYAALLQSVAASMPPLVQSDGQPSLPLSTWFTAFNCTLVACQVRQGVELMDWQQNRLLLDLLGDMGRQQLGPHNDVLQCQAYATPHAAFLEMARSRLEAPVICVDPIGPSTSAGTGKPRCTGVISSTPEGFNRGQGKQTRKRNKGNKGDGL